MEPDEQSEVFTLPNIRNISVNQKNNLEQKLKHRGSILVYEPLGHGSNAAALKKLILRK
jgi:hypothetical protein